MTNKMIKYWNHVVSNNDIVYLVGDFALCGKSKMIEIGQQLNGKKHLILGNHDSASYNTYREAGFSMIYDKPIILDNFYIISHQPMDFIPEDGVFANIFAHVHDDIRFKDVTPRSFCVSSERIGYTPINFELVKTLMKQKEEELNVFNG